MYYNDYLYARSLRGPRPSAALTVIGTTSITGAIGISPSTGITGATGISGIAHTTANTPNTPIAAIIGNARVVSAFAVIPLKPVD